MALTSSLTCGLFDVCFSNFQSDKLKVPSTDRPLNHEDLKEFWNRWHMSLSFSGSVFCLYASRDGIDAQ